MMAGVSLGSARGAIRSPRHTLKPGLFSFYNGNLVYLCDGRSAWKSTNGGSSFTREDTTFSDPGGGTSQFLVATLGLSKNDNELFWSSLHTNHNRSVTKEYTLSSSYSETSISRPQGTPGSGGYWVDLAPISGSPTLHYRVVGFLSNDDDVESRVTCQIISPVTNVDVTIGVADNVLFLPTDFEHTGDGRTPSDTTANHFWVVGFDGSTVSIKKYTNSTASTLSIDVTDASVYPHAGIWTGSAFFYCYLSGGRVAATSYRTVVNNTNLTTSPALSGLSASAVIGMDCIKLSVGVAVVVLLSGRSSSRPQLHYAIYRNDGTWSAWKLISDSTTPTWSSDPDSFLCVERFPADDQIRCGLMTTAATPSVYYYQVSPSEPPTVAWRSGSIASKFVDTSLTLSWTYRSASRLAQAGYWLKRSAGSTTQYWNGSSWGSARRLVSTSNSSVTIPANSWANVEAASGESIRFTIQVRDSDGQDSPESSEISVYSVRDAGAATITAPSSGATITGDTNLTWTTPGTQTGYRVQILTATDSVLSDSGWVNSTAKTFPITGRSGTIKVRVWWRESVHSSSQSYAERQFTLQLAPPKSITPTVAVHLRNKMASAMKNSYVHDGLFVRATIAIGASGQDIDTIEVQRREVRRRSDDFRSVNNTPVSLGELSGIESSSRSETWDDYTVAAGVQYEYRFTATATNGSVVSSSWVG